MHFDMTGQRLITFQHFLDLFILLSALGNQINIHIRIQSLDELLRLICNRIKLIIRQVKLCIFHRNLTHYQIDHHNDGQHNGCHQGIAAPAFALNGLYRQKDAESDNRQVIDNTRYIKDTGTEVRKEGCHIKGTQHFCHRTGHPF